MLADTIDLRTFSPPGQRLLDELQRDTYRTFFWVANMRAGKTVCICTAMVEEGLRDLALQRGNGEYLIAASTMGQAKAITAGHFEDICKQYGVPFEIKGGAKPHYLVGRALRYYLAGGGRKGTEDGWRGTKLTSVFLDEATTLNESFVQLILTRMDYPHGRVFMTMNPENPWHPLKLAYYDDPRDNVLVLESKWGDNPHYPPEAMAEMEAMLRATPHLYRRYILGEWVAAEGVVFPISPRMVKSVPHEKVGLVSIDPGASGVTAATLFVRVHRPGNRRGWHVADEYVHDRDKSGDMTVSEHIDALLAKGWMPREFVLDPVTGAEYRTHLQRRGYQARLADMAVDRGIIITNDALASGSLTIDPTCIELLKACAVYIFAEHSDRPVKDNDHLPDTLRYGARRLFRNRMDILERG